MSRRASAMNPQMIAGLNHTNKELKQDLRANKLQVPGANNRNYEKSSSSSSEDSESDSQSASS